MLEVDFDALTSDFIRRAEEFLREPDFSRGMELHDLAARLGVACNARVEGADRLVGVFHDFKRAIPSGDAGKLAALLEQIRESVVRGG